MTVKRHWRDKPITDLQRGAIEKIEANTKHKFQGKNRGKAADFIEVHIDESRANIREVSDNRRNRHPFGFQRDNEYGFYY